MRSALLLGLLAVTATLLVPLFAARAQEDSVETEGLAVVPIGDGGIAQAREIALQEARRDAVAEAGLVISSHTEVFNNRFVANHIAQEFAGVLSDEVVVEDKSRENGTYVVRIRATVSRGPIDRASQDAVRMMLKAQGNPRMTVVTHAIHGSEEEDAFPDAGLTIVQDSLIGALIENGFELVNSDQIQVLQEKEIEREKVIRGDLQTLRGMLASDRIAYVAVCRLSGSARPMGAVEGKWVATVRGSVQVFDTRTGEYLSAAAEELPIKVTGDTKDGAMTSAAMALAPLIHEEIRSGLLFKLAAKHRGFPVTINLTNCNFGRAMKIKRTLAKIRGWDGGTPETVESATTIRGYFTFTPDILAEQLLMSEFEDFTLEGRTVTGGYLEISCVDPEPEDAPRDVDDEERAPPR